MVLNALITGKVILWQIILGGIQVFGYVIGGRGGGFIAFLLVIFWTLAKTFNDLMVLQVLVQSTIAILLYKNSTEENSEG